MDLNDTAREQLRDAGLSPAQWAQQHFSTDEWHGDACGCPDDRCIGFHHDHADDCGCLPALLATLPERPADDTEHAAAPTTDEGHATELRRAFSQSFEGWTPNPDDLEQWPNTVRVESVEGYDTTFTGEITDKDLKYADIGGSVQLIEVDTNYKPSRDGNPVRMRRPAAASLAAAVLQAIGDTFTSRHLGSLRRDEAIDLMFALESVAVTLQQVRFAALADLAEELEPDDDGASDAQVANNEDAASEMPVSKPIPALAEVDTEEDQADEPPAVDAGEVPYTLEQQFGDALGAMFPKHLHEIASSDAYGALKYKVLHRCQATGETPTQVLATVSSSDRAFVARANDPAAFLASRIGDEW